jgi:hypothetical protein
MYSASFPTPLHVLLRKPPSQVQYKVENRPETLVADVVKKARLRAPVPPQRFWLRHSPDSVSSNENLLPVMSLGRWHSHIYAGLFDDAFYAPSSGDRAFDALLLNQQRLHGKV